MKLTYLSGSTEHKKSCSKMDLYNREQREDSKVGGHKNIVEIRSLRHFCSPSFSSHKYFINQFLMYLFIIFGALGLACPSDTCFTK